MTTASDGPPIPVDTRAAVLDQFRTDETGRRGSRPRGVAHAAGLEDVLAVMAWARDSRTPIIPRGAGTSLEGHLLARGDELGLDISVAGHIGDGNVHVVVPYTEANLPAALRFSDAVVRHALAAGGTASGEHGIGLAKKKYLHDEHGAAVEVMAALKHALDPHGLLNPGKILDV